MIAVIQCAARKRGDGYLRTKDGRRILFVADPSMAPTSQEFVYARPDDLGHDGITWREHAARYNAVQVGNPLGLKTASDLYENDTFRVLTTYFGPERTYILSAGWGLIPASFLTPLYDITFSMQAPAYVRRRKNQAFHDFSMLPKDANGPILFFGGKEYVTLFARLTAEASADRIIFYNSASLSAPPGCTLARFPTTTRTNWHYECAKAVVSGEFPIPRREQALPSP
jgi:hypothetical protein